MVITGWVQTFTAKETVCYTKISSDPPVTKQKSHLSCFSTPALQPHADFREEQTRYRKRGRAAWIIVEDIFTVTHFKVKFKPLKGAALRSSPLPSRDCGKPQGDQPWWNSRFVRKQKQLVTFFKLLLFYLMFLDVWKTGNKQSWSKMVLWVMSEL